MADNTSQEETDVQKFTAQIDQSWTRVKEWFNNELTPEQRKHYLDILNAEAIGNQEFKDRLKDEPPEVIGRIRELAKLTLHEIIFRSINQIDPSTIIDTDKNEDSK